MLLFFLKNYNKKNKFCYNEKFTFNKKKNLKKTIESIEQRRDELDKDCEKIKRLFAKSPTQEHKIFALNVMWKVLLLFLETKEVIHLESVFSDEIEAEGMQLTPDEKKKFDDACIIFNKGLPFQLAIRYNKLGPSIHNMIHRFFTDKNLRFYSAAEIKEIDEFKEKVTFTKH